MSTFENYADRYQCAKLERRDGILQITLHTNGGPLQWSKLAHLELPELFRKVGDDYGNRVIILTGAGNEFCGPRITANDATKYWPDRPPTDTEYTNTAQREMIAMMDALLAIEAPMIAAVNGPATRHCELALLCDIVLAADTATFADSGHFPAGLVPGDGVHVLFPMLLGPNRGRYFLLMDEELTARQAHELGMVGEVMSGDALNPRAWTIAEKLSTRSTTALRNTRKCIVERIRREMHELVPYGLALATMNLYLEKY
ncbi:enoyl-CoA hydratase/isomerase family protein [Bradyrhizobium commune]|uniref:Enoyl-CoA hydratase/isomerase family protein n=1 Tax=Bradyrhizobium commune TaxID=83627 RepID=A0A7S9GYK9_9BRAD|nr:enoyl-CoA hydratase/isomerase family protein [Bradyrhizobium commune]QPF90704.1 enoyl-CoA hydratase/isomerase family protein [Bradyrhizobium commune]